MELNIAYRFAVGLALTAAFLIVWLNAAAGLIGIEDRYAAHKGFPSRAAAAG